MKEIDPPEWKISECFYTDDPHLKKSNIIIYDNTDDPLW